MYSVKTTFSYDPDPCTKRSKSVLISDGRGIPCLMTNGHLILSETAYMNERALPSKVAVSFIRCLAITSAYFGPLVDRRMSRIINKKLFGIYSVFALWRWITRQPVETLLNVAPHIRFDSERIVRTADGCLWDSTGIIAALWGLENENVIGKSTVCVTCVSSFAFDEWWSTTRKRHPLYPETTIFRGDFKNQRKERLYINRHTYALYFIDCVVDTNNPWLNKTRTIDVLLIVFESPELNMLIFNKKDRWCSFQASVQTNMLTIFNRFGLDKRLKYQPFAVAFAGGGSRACIVSATTLKLLDELEIRPEVVSATSGGAWGVALQALFPNQNTVEILYARSKQFYNRNSTRDYLFGLMRKIDRYETMETLSYILPVLGAHQSDWLAIVKGLICENDENGWNAINRLKYKVIMTGTIICSSSF